MTTQPEALPVKATTLFVNLEAAPNLDFREGHPHFDVPHYQLEVPSLKAAVAACEIYISQYDLGGGNWIGGQVYDADGRQVARVSYNGRVWEPGPWQTAKEIEL